MTNIFKVSLDVLLKLVRLKCVNNFVAPGVVAPDAPPATCIHPPMIAFELKSLVVQLANQVTISAPEPVLSASESPTFGYVAVIG